MSDWITDRRPTEEDEKYVYGPDGDVCYWSILIDGDPWKPVPKCEPYVKPKRYEVFAYFGTGRWTVEDTHELCSVCHALPTRESAERIAAIYEEVMP